jgi:hypothetical protein
MNEADPQTSDEEPRKYDILFGRGSDCWNHHGNKQFRILVANYQEKYHSIQCRSEKVKLVAEIVEEIRLSGTRFLKRYGESSTWEEVDRKTTIEKVSKRSLIICLFLVTSLTPFVQNHFIFNILQQVGHAIRDKQPVKFRKRRATEIRSMSHTTDVTDFDNFTQCRENTTVNNRYLRLVTSQGQDEINFQTEESVNPNPQIGTSRGTAVRGIASYQSYLQQSDIRNIDDLAFSIPILPYHQYDDFQGYDLHRTIASRISNTLLQSSSFLKSQVLMSLPQRANLDTPRFNTVGYNTFQPTNLTDLVYSRDTLNGSPSVPMEMFLHLSHYVAKTSPITATYDPSSIF